MRFRNWIAALTLVAVALPARAADAAPTLLVRIKSLDGLIADAHYFATLAGQEEQARQAEKMLPSFLGLKDLAGTGIDTKKPIGAYGILDPQIPNSQVVVMIPVADEKVFVETLTKIGGMIPNVNAKIVKGDDGIYTISSQAAPVEAYFAVADGYAYVTALRKDSIAPGARLSAAKLLPADDRTLAGVTLRLDQIDDNLKQISLLQLENQLAAAKEKKAPNETPAQTKFKGELIDHVSRQFKALLRDGRALELVVSVDRKSDDLSADLSLTAKPGTPLANDIASQSSKPSRFGWLTDLAVAGAANIAVPAELKAGLSAALDDAFSQAQEKEKDATKKNIAKKVFDAISPTLKAGQLDLFVGLSGPTAADKFTLVAGLKVTDAPAIDRLVRELVPQIPDQKAKDAIKLDAETVGGEKVHKIVPPELDEGGKRVFGTAATGLVAFPKDAIVVAFGEDPAGLLKQFLTAPARSGGPLVLEEVSIAKVAGIGQEDRPMFKKAAEEAFGSDAKSAVVKFTVAGGTALRVKASAKGTVIKFGVKLEEAKKAGTAP
jgi:hypothetical protein